MEDKVLETIYITTNDIVEREAWSGDYEIVGELLGEKAGYEDCKRLLNKVVETAATEFDLINVPGRTLKITSFSEWFRDTDYYDDVWRLINRAIDSYIEMVAEEIVDGERD